MMSERRGEGWGRGTRGTNTPPDLRDLLREKAAGHRSFYRRLRAEGGELAVPGGPLSPAGSDEGCPAAYCSSEDEERRPSRPQRPRSRDSAVDLDEGPALAAGPAGPPLPGSADPFDSGDDHAPEDAGEHEKRDYCEEHGCYHVRSRMILEAQYVQYPYDDACGCGETDVFPGARRPSALSWDGEEGARVRLVRTPSVVVSDYSDDIHAGITPEELEYLRGQAAPLASSPAPSSCSSRASSRASGRSSGRGSAQERSPLAASPAPSDCDDDDSGFGRQRTSRKITSPH